MSFFKKLFNRVLGRKDEAPPPAAETVVQQQTLPPPNQVPEDIKVETPVLAEPEVRLERPQQTETKALELKKPEAKKPEPKKVEPPKPKLKKAEPQKQAPKQVAPKTPEPKKTLAKSSSRAVRKPVAEKPLASKKIKRDVAPPKGKGKGETVSAKVRATGKAKDVTRKRRVVEEEPAAVVVAPENEARVDASAVEEGVAEAPVLPVEAEERIVPDVVEDSVDPANEPPPPQVRVEPKPVPAAAPEPEPVRKGWFSRLKDGLSKSSKSITGSIAAIFTKRKLDTATLQDLEDTLIQADLGLPVAERIIKAIATGRYDKEIDPEEVKQILAAEVAKVLKPVEVPFNFGDEKPFVILVVGVNGSGKTTTIGKLGAIAAREGFKVKFAACDTFRAAAIEQLTVWGKRIGAETISRPPGSDAAGLAFDAMKASREDGTDILFIDTAGRLQNKIYLMDELDKVVRVIKKYDAAAPHAVLLVLDATTGQNALAQAEAFTKVAGVTGLIMTKLDGTARGGILVAIAEKFALPIHAIGVGETIDDLQAFDADAFARAIAGLDEP